MAENRTSIPAIDNRRLSMALRTLRAAKHRDDLCSVLGEFCVRYGVAHMTFLVVSSGDGSSSYPYYCTTYPESWTATYVDQRYFDMDPVIDVMRWGFLPVDWSSLDRRSAVRARFFREARAHGVGARGLTIPIRASSGERCLFSVTSELSKREWSSLRASSLHELQILSHHLHETVFHAIGFRKENRTRKLSGREVQCLQLLANGRISKQIAADLGISENAVRLYLRSARLKLGAVTSYHAVARASFRELIRI